MSMVILFLTVTNIHTKPSRLRTVTEMQKDKYLAGVIGGMMIIDFYNQ
jgi:hypothetical protein